jgi:Transposase DDE domain
MPANRKAILTAGFLWQQTGPNPTDRAKLGSKRHLICDGSGIPLAIQLTEANRNDSTQALSLVDAIPLLQGERGHPRHRPECVMGDRGYDADAIRRGLRDRGIIPFLAKRNTEHGSGLGPVAMGGGADVRLAEPVSPTASALGKAGRHSRGFSILGVRSDLLECPSRPVVAALLRDVKLANVYWIQRQLFWMKRLPCARTMSATSTGGRVIFSRASGNV